MKYLTGILLAALLSFSAVSPPTAAAHFPSEPDAEHVTVFMSCHQGSTIIELWWQARLGAAYQVIELSYVDNGFLPGTFRQEALTPLRNSVVWPRLRNGTAHYVRVAWVYGDGTWSATQTSTFITPFCPATPASNPGPSTASVSSDSSRSADREAPDSYIGSSDPPADFCSFANCIENFASGRGTVVKCADGMYSKSGGIQGACSDHGGIAR